MPDSPPPLQRPDDNKYARGPVSGALTEPEQPLIVLGDNNTEVDDVMILDFVGATVSNLGGNYAQININFQIDVLGQVGSMTGAQELNFHFGTIVNEGNGRAGIKILPDAVFDGHAHVLIQDSNSISTHWSNNPGSGTWLLGWVNNTLSFIGTTTC